MTARSFGGDASGTAAPRMAAERDERRSQTTDEMRPPSPVRPPLRPYQAAGVEFLCSNVRAYLGDDAGLGKSRQAIEAAQRGDGAILVVAPAMVLAGGNWDDEIQKWADDPGRFTQVPYSSVCAREKTGSTSSATRPLPRARPEYNRSWGTVVLDECHYVKGRKTTWTQAVRAVCARADRVILMSGTPIPNWAPELFTALQILNPTESQPGRTFGAYWRWAEEWFRVQPSRHNPRARVIGDLLACVPSCLERPPHDPCEHYGQFVKANLGDRFLQRTRDLVLPDLPPLTETQVQCPMTPAQRAAYKKMKKDYLATLGDGQMLVAWSAASRETYLDRLSVGVGVAAGESGEKLTDDSGKLARLRVDLESRTRPTVVYAHYRSSVDACVSVAESLGLRVARVDGRLGSTERGRAVRAFQAGKVDVLVGSLETLAEGLTLVQADMAIFVEKSFKPSRNEQARRRIHRLGQDRPVTILDYVTPGTVDAAKRKLLATKTDRALRFMTAAQFADLL